MNPQKAARPAPAGASLVLQARVDVTTRERFVAAARKRNTTAASALKGLIAGYIEQPDTGAVKPPPAGADDSAKGRVVITLPLFLKDALKARALHDGYSPSAWTANMIQSILMEMPVMTDKEVELLHYASRQLAAVGRNLNQIAKNMNRAALMEIPVPDKEDLRIAMIDELRRSVAGQRKAISKLVRARYRAWGNHEDRNS